MAHYGKPRAKRRTSEQFQRGTRRALKRGVTAKPKPKRKVRKGY